MGWSCAAKADDAMQRVNDECVRQSGSSNVYRDTRFHFYEVSRVEHEDGAITGSVYTGPLDGETVRRSGSFRFEPDGRLSRGPAWMKRALAEK